MQNWASVNADGTRVLTNRKGQQVTARYSDEDAMHRLYEYVKDQPGSFGESLCKRGARFGLTDEQAFWVHKLLNERERPQTPAHTITVGTAIIAMFDKAIEHLKYPKIRFPGLIFSRAGNAARFPGSVNVTSAHQDREQRIFYGRVHRNGFFESGASATGEILERIIEICLDPANLAGIQGRECGSCCFCSRALTDARSTAVGYGPICAERFGLPWGVVQGETCTSERCLAEGH